MSTADPTTVNLKRKRGDTYADVIRIKSATTGAVEDITGRTYLMTVSSRRLPDSTTYQQFQMTGNITDAANGLVEFAPSSSQANRTGPFYHDIQETNSGVVRTIAIGRYTMTQDITK